MGHNVELDKICKHSIFISLKQSGTLKLRHYTYYLQCNQRPMLMGYDYAYSFVYRPLINLISDVTISTEKTSPCCYAMKPETENQESRVMVVLLDRYLLVRINGAGKFQKKHIFR